MGNSFVDWGGEKTMRVSYGGSLGAEGWALEGARERARWKSVLQIGTDLVGTNFFVSLKLLADFSLGPRPS